MLSQRKAQNTALFTHLRVLQKQKRLRVLGGAVGSYMTWKDKNKNKEGGVLLITHADKMEWFGWLNISKRPTNDRSIELAKP